MAVQVIGVLLLTNYFLVIQASYHWRVNENGRITSQVESSGFPLAKPDDLIALLGQELRVQAIDSVYKQLMASKMYIDKQWSKIEREGDVEKRLYSTDLDCLLGEMPLSQHLFTEFLDYGQGTRPKMKTGEKLVEPDCTEYSKLDFSMRTFPHLETLNKRNDFNLSITSPPSSKTTPSHYNINAMLKLNNSDWTAYNIASLYWRMIGNGSNALECAKRALYFSPRETRYIVLLNLGTLLQELQSLGEAAIVLHSAVDHDPEQDISHLALGNVYAALGDYRRSLACYDNVLSLNPANARAIRLKHALMCHKKLEMGLLETHSSLQKILKDLHKHNALHEDWIHLQHLVGWVRSRTVKDLMPVSKPLYLNLQMLLHNVEYQANTLREEVIRRVPKNHMSLNGGRKKPGGCCGADTKPGDNLDEEDIYIVWEDEEEDDGEVESEEEEEEDQDGEVEEEEYEEEEYHHHHHQRTQHQSHFLKNRSKDYVVSNIMNSLLTFIKSNYEDEINLITFKKRIDEQFKRSPETIDRPTSLSENLGACVKDSSDVKKLN